MNKNESILESIAHKATMAYWSCQRLLGKTKTNSAAENDILVMSTCYKIYPMITYASTVWWPKFKKK